MEGFFYFRSTSSFKKRFDEQCHLFGGVTKLKFSEDKCRELRVWQFPKVSVDQDGKLKTDISWILKKKTFLNGEISKVERVIVLHLKKYFLCSYLFPL